MLPPRSFHLSPCCILSLSPFLTTCLLNTHPSAISFPCVMQCIFLLQKPARTAHPSLGASISTPVGLRRHFPRTGDKFPSQMNSTPAAKEKHLLVKGGASSSRSRNQATLCCVSTRHKELWRLEQYEGCPPLEMHMV